MKRWKRLSNMLTCKAMLDLSDRMSRDDVAHPGLLPDLAPAKTLMIATDISGSRNDQYEIYSFLITGQELLGPWLEARQVIRAAHLPDGRRMSYKTLNDKVRQRALLPFLEAADSIQGLLFNVAIDTRLASIFGDPNEVVSLARRFEWKPKILERLLRVMHFTSFLLAGLSRPQQNVLWICDEDAILANEKMARDVERMLPSVWDMYLSHRMGRGGFMTTAVDSGDRHIEDLAAIPDLAAGVCFEQLRTGSIPGTRRLAVQGRSVTTLRWLSSQLGQLAKRTLCLTTPADGLGGVQMDWLNFDMAAAPTTSVEGTRGNS